MYTPRVESRVRAPKPKYVSKYNIRSRLSLSNTLYEKSCAGKARFVYLSRGPSPVSAREVSTVRDCRCCVCAQRLSNTPSTVPLNAKMRARCLFQSAVMLSASTPPLDCTYLMYSALRGLINNNNNNNNNNNIFIWYAQNKIYRIYRN